MQVRLSAWGAALALLPALAQAGGVENLRAFVSQTQSAKGAFRQMVVDKNLAVINEAAGFMEFIRPGKFRWVYEKPKGQMLIGDGEKLWVYDAELRQVTVRKIDQALGSSPAAILAGKGELEKHFRLKELGKRGSLEWVEATPLRDDSGFDSVRMGFDGPVLDVMELRDSFGQTTVIRFPAMERNVKLPASQFKFTPPKGVDVISD